MEIVIITSKDSSIIPVSIQDSIREAFCFSKNKEVQVKKRDEDGEYDVYQNGKYLDTITHYKNPFIRGAGAFSLHYQ